MVSSDAQHLVGILLISLVTVESGGLYLLRLARTAEGVTDFQRAFACAGHAHAGVLLVLAVAVQPFVDASDLDGWVGWVARTGVAVAALLMPAGFFFSSMGRGRTAPNRWVVLVLVGGAWLAGSLLLLGISLLV